MKHMFWLTTLMTSAALAGCGGGGDDTPATPDAPPATPTPDARPAAQVVATVSPDNATAGDALTLEVAVTNFTLVDPTSTPPPDPAIGEGHFHIYFDDSPDYSAAWDPETGITTTPEDAGTHTIRVILVNSLHMELAPVTESTVTFTLAPAT